MRAALDASSCTPPRKMTLMTQCLTEGDYPIGAEEHRMNQSKGPPQSRAAYDVWLEGRREEARQLSKVLGMRVRIASDVPERGTPERYAEYRASGQWRWKR